MFREEWYIGRATLLEKKKFNLSLMNVDVDEEQEKKETIFISLCSFVGLQEFSII